MSGFLSIPPPPIPLGAMRNTDTDGAFGMNFTNNMVERNDTIATFRSVVVSRIDGRPINSGDPTIVGLFVDSTKYMIGWTVQANGSIAQYVLSATIVTTNGETLTRDAYLETVALIG